ncbi:TonB C-terminal domain-containing protein [Aggregicoccus sp. 17bor-14]|uniref:energy transducer TonB n=1 Tax=Myxococcaceae TaxID=31 RepID=UPI00129C4BBE|nr:MULTISPECIES: energy transducer TonB [Myxococcaceae]MBF5044264.1 TonB C-terminal domain-containing protein [Simulacricoccus sp. 17bor-14]MRI90014.1 TonB C-terminal domain-containing protein [Aggregicoccus sp. 17bor-14]
MHPAVSHSLLVSRPSPVRRFLLASVMAHAVLVASGLIYNLVIAKPALPLDAKPITATLVRQGKPRDKALLPRKEELPPPPKEEKAAPTPPAPTPEPAKPVEAGPAPLAVPAAAKPPPQKGDSAAERRKKLFGAFDRTSKSKSEPEELEGEEDGDPNGDSATAEGERYYGLLSSQVKRRYDVSDTIPDSERLQLRAQVALRISRSGEVIDVKLAKGSGNDLFDAAVLAAVKRASPFSPPPEALRNALQRDGVVLEFRP